MGELRSQLVQNQATDPPIYRFRQSRAASAVTGMALVAGIVGTSACGSSQSEVRVQATATPTELPPSLRPTSPNTKDTPPSIVLTAPVKVKPNLCIVLPPEVVEIAIGQSLLQQALDSCQGLEHTSNSQGLVASAEYNATATRGVYNDLYSLPASQSEKFPPQTFVESQHDGMVKVVQEAHLDITVPDVVSIKVNGIDGKAMSNANSTWAEVEVNNGGQPLELNVSMSPPAKDIEAYMSAVVASILQPPATTG